MSAVKSGPGVFITGTDTGVGKTIVTAALAYHFSSMGLSVGVMKPVETGVDNPGELGPDGKLLRWAAQSNDPDDQISPFRLCLPASPHQAAKAESSKIDIEAITKAFDSIRQDKDIVLVEGAGGLMVPLRGGFLMADLITEMQIPALVVTHPHLGTLNHTLLTTFSARAMSIDLCGMVINKMPAAPAPVENEAPHLLASLASTDLLCVLSEEKGTDKEIVVSLANSLETMPSYQWLLSAFSISI